MPALKNARHERFCRELAKGKSQVAAYEAAGYKPHDGAAARLCGNVRIKARMAELQGRGAERAAVTVESLIDEADEIRRAAMKVAQYAAANGALTLKAKLAGKLVDRVETGKPGDFDRMTDDELADFVRTEAAALGVGERAPRTAAARDQAGLRGKPRDLH